MLIPRGVLKLALCAATEKTRYAMNGLAVERDDSGTVKVTATDGKRLVRAELAPMTDAARALGETFGIADNGARIGLTLIPTMDETCTKGSETITSLGLLSLIRNERKASSVARKAMTGPDKPRKPKMTANPKRPKLPSLPILPKRSAFVPNDNETIDAALARFRSELSEARERRATVKADRARIIEDWKGVRRAVKSQNAARKDEHKASIARWKADRIEARKARDVVAFEMPRNVDGSLISVALAPGRIRELRALEGHFPPVDDVIPSPNRPHGHELIVDARAIELIVESWRAMLRADERATCGEQADMSHADELSGIVLEMEGQNVKMSGRINGRAFELSEAQRENIERWMRVVHGEGKVRIGLNAFFLAEMADALNSAIGKPGSMSVRIGIKSESDAVLVAPCAVDESTGPAFMPCVRGVKATGVLMPINLA